ncbi:MAG TPA: DNA repair protein RadA, partial [Firmicutes bacterium]|nr:DNA repair protein RadA [Bacillota bacterium]
MKKETKYRCKVCGYETIMKLGKCPNCGSWNSFEEVESEEPLKKKNPVVIETQKEERIKTGFAGFDELLGGGIVRGSIILLSGEPGIGKSTLLLQIAL